MSRCFFYCFNNAFFIKESASLALTELGKANAANKSINNLRIKKESFIPPILDRLSIIFLDKFALPFVKEVFEGIYFII